MKKRIVIASSLSLVMAVMVVSSASAQLPAGLDLRVWLKADDLVNDGLNFGDDVNLWTDASTHGTTFEPDLTIESAPKLEQVSINGANVPAVKFTASGPPTDTNNTRLRQTSNLTATGVGDPTNIVEGDDMTLFVVFNPTHVQTPLINFQSIAGKRSGAGSPWTFGLQDGAGGANAGQLNYVHFGPGLPHRSGNDVSKPNHNILLENTWHISGMTIEENNPNNILDFFTDNIEDSDPLTFLGAVDAANPPFGNPVDPVTGANGPIGNGPIPEAMVIAGNNQPGPGLSERFNGHIAELIIFADALSPAEFGQVQGYLNAKYNTIPEPTAIALAMVAAGTLALCRRRS
ncbi:MAG: hypothetical protein AAGD11_11170 [Planctomycetota bacterium]